MVWMSYSRASVPAGSNRNSTCRGVQVRQSALLYPFAVANCKAVAAPHLNQREQIQATVVSQSLELEGRRVRVEKDAILKGVRAAA